MSKLIGRKEDSFQTWTLLLHFAFYHGVQQLYESLSSTEQKLVNPKDEKWMLRSLQRKLTLSPLSNLTLDGHESLYASASAMFVHPLMQAKWQECKSYLTSAARSREAAAQPNALQKETEQEKEIETKTETKTDVPGPASTGQTGQHAVDAQKAACKWADVHYDLETVYGVLQRVRAPGQQQSVEKALKDEGIFDQLHAPSRLHQHRWDRFKVEPKLLPLRLREMGTEFKVQVHDFLGGIKAWRSLHLSEYDSVAWVEQAWPQLVVFVVDLAGFDEGVPPAERGHLAEFNEQFMSLSNSKGHGEGAVDRYLELQVQTPSLKAAKLPQAPPASCAVCAGVLPSLPRPKPIYSVSGKGKLLATTEPPVASSQHSLRCPKCGHVADSFRLDDALELLRVVMWQEWRKNAARQATAFEISKFPFSRVTLVFNKVDAFREKMKSEFEQLATGAATLQSLLPARCGLYRSSYRCLYRSYRCL